MDGWTLPYGQAVRFNRFPACQPYFDCCSTWQPQLPERASRCYWLSAASQSMLLVGPHPANLIRLHTGLPCDQCCVLPQVNLAEVDIQMVRLAQKQRRLLAALAEKDTAQDRLTEVMQLRGSPESSISVTACCLVNVSCVKHCTWAGCTC